jgi:hypothetical protein
MSLGGGAALARHRREQLDRRRRRLRGRGRQRQLHRPPGRTPATTRRPRARGDDDRRHHQQRRQGLVVELRQLRRLVRARRQHHLGLAHEQHRDEHDQRHLDGRAAHRGAAALYLEANPGARSRRGSRCATRSTRLTTKGIVTSRARRTTTCCTAGRRHHPRRERLQDPRPSARRSRLERRDLDLDRRLPQQLADRDHREQRRLHGRHRRRGRRVVHLPRVRGGHVDLLERRHGQLLIAAATA